MAHHLRSGGTGAMDIDHHDPGKSLWTKNSYDNLFLASRHCNGKKGKRWPKPEQLAAGVRYLNPCKEVDYGHQIFEDPATFEVWGATPAAKYHVRMLDLNAEHLVRERRSRFDLWALWRSKGIVTMRAGANLTDVATGIRVFKSELDLMIPLIAQQPKPVRLQPAALSQPALPGTSS